MNILTGKINWALTKDKKIQENNRFSNRILELYIKRIHNFNFDNKNYFYNGKTKIICAIIGYISNLDYIKSRDSIDNKNDVEIIEKLYNLKGPKFISDLDGVFSIFIWDENRQEGYIFQDEYGSNLPLYYTISKGKFIFSTCLKEILKELPFKRELNLSAVYDFLFCELVIPNRLTLIKNVNKLLPGQYLVIKGTRSSVKIKRLNIKEKRVTEKFAKDNLIKSIQKSVKVLSRQLNSKNLTCALSRGFDTNLILYFLSKLKQARLSAVTIGGETINEIPQARMCVNQYYNVRHIYRLIKADKLNYFPDIVWRAEGYICGYRSFFLLHELSEQLEKKKIKCIFLGECADSLFDRYANSKMAKLRNKIKGVIDYCYNITIDKELPDCLKVSRSLLFKKILRRPLLRVNYNCKIEFFLKKSGIMNNSYSVQGIYPFLNRDTKIISKSLGKLNVDKRFYKKEVKKVLGEKKSEYIKKLKGYTDIEYLFKNKSELIRKLLKSKFIKQTLSRKQIDRIVKNPDYYFDFILRLFFLYLFNELFVSGKFDSKFNDPHLDRNLSDFFD